MRFKEFSALVQDTTHPVILLEGMRALPDSDREQLVSLGSMLAGRFANARFRTGNATGTDEAFAAGVADVDVSRLEYVLPYAGHRKKMLVAGAATLVFEEVPGAVESTLKASPDYKSLMDKRNVVPRLGAKAKYILRDTVKVTGVPEQGFTPATIGLFYADPSDPMNGGTGHTIRVCRHYGVPDILQRDWLNWLEESKI